MSDKSLVVIWRVTERCNLACPFCAYDRRLDRSRREADPEQILGFGLLLAEYARVAGTRVLVSWLGGEPLRWPPLVKLTEQLHEAGLSISATTNGTNLAAPGMSAHLLQHYAEITVSVDGFGATHDQSRNWPGGFEMLQREVTKLAAARRRGEPSLRVNILLQRETLRQLTSLCHELATWGIDEITFNQLGGNDRPEFYPPNRLLPEQAAWLAAEVPALRTSLAGRNVRLGGSDGYLRRIYASTQNLPLAVEHCRPGEDLLFIDEAGIAGPCSFANDKYGIHLSQLQSVEGLIALPARFRALRASQRHPACEDCQSTRVFEKFALTSA